MLARGEVDEAQLFADRASAEEHHHDEGVGEAYFGAVDGAVARGFEDGEEGGQVGV